MGHFKQRSPASLAMLAAMRRSGRRVGSPDSKAHLVSACGATVHSDVRVASFRKLVDARNLHFFPAPTLGQFSAAGH